jgi:chromosomal replication initiation ATPase DnaA
MLSEEWGSDSWCRRIPLATIDRVVVARLGQTRVSGNAKPAVLNRQIAMYIAKHIGGWSTTRIGIFYNGRDHSTVCYALKRVCALRKDDARGVIGASIGFVSFKPSSAFHMPETWAIH